MRNLIVAVGAILLFTACASQPEPAASAQPASSDRAKDLVARVLGDTEDVWDALFRDMGRAPYPQPKLVLYRAATRSACGPVSGSLYCAADRQIYFDVALVDELRRRFGKPGDFAVAYLIARDVGHHVQNVLGTTRRLERDAAQMDEPQRNDLHLRFELQADCYAGVRAHYVRKRKLLEADDIEKGLPAAIGIDQAATRNTATLRIRWFDRGLAGGEPRQCDPFAATGS